MVARSPDPPVSPKRVFRPEQRRTLFAHVLLDDVPRFDAGCPAEFLPACTQEELEDAYWLSWDLLESGVDFPAFRKLVLKTAFSGVMGSEMFRDVRACFKHCRYACRNLDRRRRSPWILQTLTLLMGEMQDFCKNGKRFRALFTGLLLWAGLGRPVLALLRRQARSFQPGTPEGLRARQAREDAELRDFLQGGERPTPARFHAMRKIISRRVSFNDTLRTLRPSEDLHCLSHRLATINGLMGDFHDALVEASLKGELSYKKDRIALPEQIRDYLQGFLERRP